jgi:hypothetical protein
VSRLLNHLRSNLVAYVCLGLLLGGTAVAATTLPRNSVTTKTIRNGQVKAPDLGRRAVRAAKIAPGAVGGEAVGDDSLSGADVDEASLSGVLSCPAGFARAVDVCFESNLRIATWPNAIRECGEDGLRLPTLPEAYLMAKALPNPPGQQFYWAADDAGGGAAWAVLKNPDGSVQTTTATQFPTSSFRCVTSPSD